MTASIRCGSSTRSLKVPWMSLPCYSLIWKVSLFIHTMYGQFQARSGSLQVRASASLVSRSSLTAGLNFAVWIQGAIASEPTLDWNRQPVFLIDSRTRSGSSGSPVIAYRPGVRLYEDGRTVIGGTESRFLGVYSGRVNADSDLGMVWKASAVREIIEGERRPPRDLDAPEH